MSPHSNSTLGISTLSLGFLNTVKQGLFLLEETGFLSEEGEILEITGFSRKKLVETERNY